MTGLRFSNRPEVFRCEEKISLFFYLRRGEFEGRRAERHYNRIEALLVVYRHG